MFSYPLVILNEWGYHLVAFHESWLWCKYDMWKKGIYVDLLWPVKKLLLWFGSALSESYQMQLLKYHKRKFKMRTSIDMCLGYLVHTLFHLFLLLQPFLVFFYMLLLLSLLPQKISLFLSFILFLVSCV